MERYLAEILIGGLESHPPLTPGILADKNYFVNLLVSTQLKPSRRFYEEVGSNEAVIQNPAMDLTHYVSIKRVLRNRLAKEYKLSWLKARYEAAASAFGIYDSDALTRKLRIGEDIVRMMAEAAQSGQPYSLLGKLETVDGILEKISRRPLVIIPNVGDLSRILAWEDANTSPSIH